MNIPQPVYADEGHDLHVYLGDCLADGLLAALPDCSVDAVVTDPPYELGFMGRSWDRSGIAYNVDMWRQVLRVLRPGGHLLAFGGMRTQHRLACAIEDAGFEIRDAITWLFGSGFPKSRNVTADLIQTVQPDARCVCVQRSSRTPGGSPADYPSSHDSGDALPRPATGTGPATPRRPDGAPEHNHDGPRTDARVAAPASTGPGAGTDRLATEDSVDRGRPLTVAAQPAASGPSDTRMNTSPAAGEVLHRTPSRTQHIDGSAYDSAPHKHMARCDRCGGTRVTPGLGTALKPAAEIIVVARKPLAAGTVAQNVLQHGTGALNIDACRIEHQDDLSRYERSATSGYKQGGVYGDGKPVLTPSDPAGRWPANVTLDEHHEPVLHLRYNLPEGIERAIREYFGASTDHLPPVRYADVGPAEQGGSAAILQPKLLRGMDGRELDRRESGPLREGAHAGLAAQDGRLTASEGSHWAEGDELARWQVQEQRLHPGEGEQPASFGADSVRVDGVTERPQLHPGAQASGRTEPRASTAADGDRSPSQRSEGRQPPRESGATRVERGSPDEARRDRRGDVPPTARDRRSAGDPLEVLSRDCPPAWLRYFEVVGHRREGMAAELDQQSGNVGAAAPVRGTEQSAAVEPGTITGPRARVPGAFYGDSGGASRFFPVFRYEAKAPTSERPKDDDGNGHATVKPLDLMRWLVRLVCPPGGLVLDPFLGSGTTAEACLIEQLRCVGFEKDPDHIPLIRARLDKPIEIALF